MPGLCREDGVLVQDATAPSRATLRPKITAEPGRTFPVYRDLVERLVRPATPLQAGAGGPDGTVAHVLAVCAGYAYSDAETVSTMMARMGLEDNRVRLVGEYVDAMFIDSTAFVVQSDDGRVVILAYRGTPPMGLISWLTDADVSPTLVGLEGGASPSAGVHAGFYRNTRATRYKVTEALDRALAGESVTGEPGRTTIRPMERLYITGHSLGGAMAAINALLMLAQARYEDSYGEVFGGVYTFGQPMVGDAALGRLADAPAVLGDGLYRFLYEKDPVPFLPPSGTGTFVHFGREFRYEAGTWQERTGRRRAGQMRPMVGLLSAGTSFVTRNLPDLAWIPTGYRAYDHAPQNYIAALTPPDVPSEFGDYPYLPARADRR